MAVQRPNAIVFQEYTTISVAPDIPDLDVLIVGPCYQILDYLDDKDEIDAGDYGELDTPMSTYGVPSSLVITVPPNIEAGALLDASSVKIFFDGLRAVLFRNTAPGTDDATFYEGYNLFCGGDGESGVNFGVSGIQAGDKLISESGASSADYVKVVKELAYKIWDNGGGGATVDFQTIGVVAGDSLVIFDDQAAASRNGIYAIQKIWEEGNPLAPVTTAIEVADSSLLIGQTAQCHIRIMSAAGTVKYDSSDDPTPPTHRVELGDWCSLLTTTDFDTDNDAVSANREWRIERQLDDVEIDPTYVTIDNQVVTIDQAGIGVQVAVNTTLGNKPVSFANVYMEYLALRQDLQRVIELTSSAAMEETLGKLDARNPLYVGAYVAAQNTTTPIKIYGVKSDDLTGYNDFIDRISSDRDIYAIVPLTYNTSVIGVLNVMATSYSDPTYVLDNGIIQKFRVILGAVDLVTQDYVTNETGGASILQIPTPAPTGNKTLTVNATDGGGAANPTYDMLPMIPGQKVLITGIAPPVTYGPYTVAHVNGATVLETDEDIHTAIVAGIVLSGAGDKIEVFEANGVTPVVGGAIEVGVGGIVNITLTGSALDKLYNILSCPTATFIDDGIIPGDIIQIPLDPESSVSWVDYQAWVVASVDSQTRLTIVNDGTNTSTVANELPHLIKRSGTPTDRTITVGQVYFRVQRNMTKDEQITYMVEVAQSFSSKRVVLAYPNEVDITDLTDGSKDRGGLTTPTLADPQEGYYLACAIGGQTAGNPSQQGFTNMGISGVSRIYNSSEYFTEKHLTDLSNGGVYVFVQDNPDALPYSIHEVTTDILALETGEYMLVKNFDFIATTFLNALFPFLGRWNIHADTIRFIRNSLYATIANLQSRYVARIGAPLTSASIDDVFQATHLSEDRIEAYVSVNMPMVLNTLGLHLVA